MMLSNLISYIQKSSKGGNWSAWKEEMSPRDLPIEDRQPFVAASDRMRDVVDVLQRLSSTRVRIVCFQIVSVLERGDRDNT